MEPDPIPPSTPSKARKRRRIRVLPILGYVTAALGLSWFFESRLPTTFVLVRHAEAEAAMEEGGDPPLSAAGRERAELLADFLQNIDVVSSVNAIYASDRRRTQQTAEPLAKRLGLEVQVDPQQDVERLVREIQRDYARDIVLIVSHRNIIGPLIAELHGKQPLPEIGPDDYDNVYIVTVPWFGSVKTLRLHYGQQSPGVDLSGGSVPTTVIAPR
jgi:phosphohistidine phosphatase SixA